MINPIQLLMKKKTKTEHVLIFMKVLAWMAFFGFVVVAGIYLISFLLSLWNPDAANDIYEGLNLYELRQASILRYSFVMVFLILMTIMKAKVWFMVIKIIRKLKIKNPFTLEIATQLENIAYWLFAIWVLAAISGGYFAWIGDMAGDLNDSWDHGQFLFMAGLVFIISQIFKRGVEIQSENELTV